MSEPPTEPVGGDALSRSRLVIIAGASGLLLSCAFPPLDLGPVALVALVPLLWLWQRSTIRRGALSGFVFGVAFFAVLLWWMHTIGFVGYIPLVVVMAAWWALAGAVVAALRARSPLVIAAVVVLVELARARWPLGGFSWGGVGYALHDVAPARTLAAWGGVTLVGAVAVAVNAFVVDALRGRWFRGGVGIVVVVAVTAVAAVATPSLTSTGSFTVAIAQGNDKNRRLTIDELSDRYLVRSHLRLAAELRKPVDLIVFPESSLDTDPRVDASVGDAMAAVARQHGSALLVNANADAPRDRVYNTNLLYRPDGTLAGTYVKEHLVPFGEYVPWRNRLGFIRELRQVPQDFAPGHALVTFSVAGHRVGTMICFESAFPPQARAYARRGADILVVSTNNRSFGRTANAAQHVAMGQFRAAETGRPVVHAAISGESALIDAHGDVRARTRLFERTLLVGSVTGRRGRTPYVRLGDTPLLLVSLGVVLGGAVVRRRR